MNRTVVLGAALVSDLLVKTLGPGKRSTWPRKQNTEVA